MTSEHIIPANSHAVPPSPRGYPLLGVLPMLLRNPLQFVVDAARQYGDFIDFRVGTRHFYLLSHPDHLKHVLQERHRNYRKGVNIAILKRLMGEGLVTSEGDLWLRQRRLMQPAFHHQRLAHLATVMTDVAATMLKRWQTSAPGEEVFDAVAEMTRLTQQVIVRTMFSTSIGDEAESVHHALNNVFSHLSRLLWTSALPPRLTPGNRRFEQSLKTLDDIVYRIIAERRCDKTEPGDLLTMLLQARDEESGEGMSDSQIRDEVMTLFVAGHETTASLLAWTWHLLAQHPEVEACLHAELSKVLGGRIPTFHDLPQLTYTKMVIEEVLRLYPAGWVLFRTPLSDDSIAGYHIPAGSVVMLSPYVLHRNPTFWEEPERFDPERFTPERSAGRPRYAYVPFGGGPRQCIGNSFALMEAQLILATVAQHYRLRSVPGHPVKPHVSVVLQPQHGILMTRHPRAAEV